MAHPRSVQNDAIVEARQKYAVGQMADAYQLLESVTMGATGEMALIQATIKANQGEAKGSMSLSEVASVRQLSHQAPHQRYNFLYGALQAHGHQYRDGIAYFESIADLDGVDAESSFWLHYAHIHKLNADDKAARHDEVAAAESYGFAHNHYRHILYRMDSAELVDKVLAAVALIQLPTEQEQSVKRYKELDTLLTSLNNKSDKTVEELCALFMGYVCDLNMPVSLNEKNVEPYKGAMSEKAVQVLMQLLDKHTEKAPLYDHIPFYLKEAFFNACTALNTTSSIPLVIPAENLKPRKESILALLTLRNEETTSIRDAQFKAAESGLKATSMLGAVLYTARGMLTSTDLTRGSLAKLVALVDASKRVLYPELCIEPTMVASKSNEGRGWFGMFSAPVAGGVAPAHAAATPMNAAAAPVQAGQPPVQAPVAKSWFGFLTGAPQPAPGPSRTPSPSKSTILQGP